MKHYNHTFVSDVKQSLSSLSVVLKNPDTYEPITGVLISVETNAIRFTTDGLTEPVAGSIGHSVSAGGTLYLTNVEQINNLEICNSAAGSNAVIQISTEIRKGRFV